MDTILPDTTCIGLIPIPDLGAEVGAMTDVENRSEIGAENGIGIDEREVGRIVRGVSAPVGADPIPEPDLSPETG